MGLRLRMGMGFRFTGMECGPIGCRLPTSTTSTATFFRHASTASAAFTSTATGALFIRLQPSIGTRNLPSFFGNCSNKWNFCSPSLPLHPTSFSLLHKNLFFFLLFFFFFLLSSTFLFRTSPQTYTCVCVSVCLSENENAPLSLVCQRKKNPPLSLHSG